MNLEDHLGDIIRKGRLMSGVSAAEAAKAAGLTSGELAAIEESGMPNARTNYRSLAALIGLNEEKLKGIANGWSPANVDLRLWRELRWIVTSNGMAVNCYLVWDEVSREAAVFDTGWDARPVLREIEACQLLLRHIFITHGHEDHVADLDGFQEAFPRARLHSNSGRAPAGQRNRPGDVVGLGSLRISHRDTPGHAEDGATYVIGSWPEDAPEVAVVGDALFAGSMGRGNPSWDLAREKVREEILSLPPETLICPGHGPLTTVAQEKANNPFF